MRLLLRADADVRAGTGHVMRCLALAQAWSDAGGRAVLLSAPLPPALETRLGAEGLAVVALQAAPGSPEDAAETARQAQERGAEWVVADGYHFEVGFGRALKEAGHKILVLDDNGGADTSDADLVLNQNIHAQADWYGESPGRLLLGPRYALLRREFRTWRGWQRETPEIAHKALVTLGGSDPDNVTRKVVEALSLVGPERLDPTIVIGGGNPHRAALEAEASRLGVSARFVTNPPDLPALMADADLAVSAAGSTVWELAFLGVPSLLVVTAANQRGIAQGMDAGGAARSLGEAGDLTAGGLAQAVTALRLDPARRAEMSRRAREIVDGSGAARVVEAMQDKTLRLRAAEPGDCRLAWEWANDPAVRDVSFSQALIPWESHVAWFDARLRDPQTLFYIGLVPPEGTALGLARFAVSEAEAVISVVVAPEFRSRGWGVSLIEAASQRAFRECNATRIRAYVKPENAASLRAFAKAGYGERSEAATQGQPARSLILQKKTPS